MHKTTRLGLLLSSVLTFGTFAIPAIAATENLPTSSSSTHHDWLRMNPTTFQVSDVAVLDQYDRAAHKDSRLTAQNRAKLVEMLAAKQGVEVTVPDGITLDILTGRCNNAPCVYTAMRKQLGRDDRALMFDLGEGVTMYWFTGVKDQSCNNIGVVFGKPKVPFGMAPPPPPPPPKFQYRLERVTTVIPVGDSMYLSPVWLASCCCQPIMVGGYVVGYTSTDRSTTYMMVRN